jgi:DNA-binding transcriptional LysR family regulator
MAFDARVLSGIGVLAAVVEAGSFARAATALGLTQSGVSRAVARLEERVGVRLLQRSSRAVTLTDEGRRFYERVAPMLAGIEDAAGEAHDSSRRPRGHLRVCIDALVARVIVGPGAAAFLAAYPDLSLEVVVRAHIGDLVADGFDVAVRSGEPEPSTLIARKVLETRVLTCASRAYLERRGRPKHPRDVAHHECILFRNPSTGRPYDWVFQRGAEIESIEVHGRLVVNDSSAALEACAAGHGLIQPLEIELRRRGDLDLVQVLPEWADERFPLYVYHPSRRLVPAKVRALIDFMVATRARAESGP